MAKPTKVEILDGHTIKTDQDAPPGFTEEPGMVGAFTREQAPGAIPNGTRIVKHYAEAWDANPVGAHGVVLGSMMDDQLGKLVGELLAPALRHGNENSKYLYFVEWDNAPGRAVVVLGAKIKRADFLPQAFVKRATEEESGPDVIGAGLSWPTPERRDPEPDFKPGGGTFGGGGASGSWEEDKPSAPAASESFGSCTPDSDSSSSSSSSSDSGSSSSDSGGSDSGGSSSSGSE